MSSDLGTEIELGLETLETVHKQITSLVEEIHSQDASDIETAAACAMLHSFYTEMEKILKLIAQNWTVGCRLQTRGIKNF